MSRVFVEKYIDTLSHFDRQRYEDKIDLIGFDPYSLVEEELSEDVSLWPKITPVDRMDYFIYKTNFATKEAMRAYKSLEAHNFFTSGLVFRPRIKEVDSEHVVVLGKVHHSQRHSLDPLRLWIYVKKVGEIIVGHCTCMAGLGETCSHVAAVVFLIEYGTKAEEDLTCTDRLNAWLPPTMTTVPFAEVRTMNFSSASSRLKQLEAIKSPSVPSAPSRTPQQIDPNTATLSTEDADFLAAVAGSNPSASVLSTYPDHSDIFIPPELPPLVLKNLYDRATVDLTFEEVLQICLEFFNKLEVTADQINQIEEKTRGQWKNTWWVWYRLGRITSSNMSKIFFGNPQNPAMSTVTSICYGGKEFKSADCDRGKKLEEHARRHYLKLQQKHHVDMEVRDCGFYICKDHPFIGASPDGIVSCKCCSGVGCLEIKCPRLENVLKCFDGDTLLEDHDYRFQVQTHMLATGGSYCDFMTYAEEEVPNVPEKTIHHKLIRVNADEEFQASMVSTAKVYFLNVLLPELLSQHFSRGRKPLAPVNVDRTGQTTVICFCQTPRRNPLIICSGTNCTFKEFHCRCVGLAGPRKSKWYCLQCQIQDVRRNRKKRRRDENCL